MRDVRRVGVTCDRCGNVAAEFVVYPAEFEGAPAMIQGDRIERTGFMGTVTQPGSYEALCARLDAVATGDFVRLRREWHPDWVGFHCRECDRVYCQQCWRIGPPQFDEGFYDCTSATCPAGHEQIVDD